MNNEVNTFGIRGIKHSENFNKRILKTFTEPINISLYDAGMQRAGGYGQYYRFVDCEINGERKTIRVHHSSSPCWDEFKDLEFNSHAYSNYLKRLIITVLENVE